MRQRLRGCWSIFLSLAKVGNEPGKTDKTFACTRDKITVQADSPQNFHEITLRDFTGLNADGGFRCPRARRICIENLQGDLVEMGAHAFQDIGDTLDDGIDEAR